MGFFLKILVPNINELNVKNIKLKEDKNNINTNIEPKNLPLCSSVSIFNIETPLPW